MGTLFSSFQREYKFVCTGFDGAGKTSVVYAYMKDCVIYGVPILGYNMEYSKFVHSGRKIYVRTWDVYEECKQLWRLGQDEEIDGIIWVVNSSEEHNRLPEVKRVLHKLLLEPSLQNLPLLVFANKQDLPNPLTPAQVTKLLDLESLSASRKWTVRATRGMGAPEEVESGFEWIINAINNG
eukprot:Phypoly_transcript_17016.p2 GENE.Phypoly_transcript_17016~~Phypoly_transcript_17016.p2  ORF type:complete len:181 (+),score=37.59 Phypoly_transcript_17016:54-596(+)